MHHSQYLKKKFFFFSSSAFATFIGRIVKGNAFKVFFTQVFQLMKTFKYFTPSNLQNVSIALEGSTTCVEQQTYELTDQFGPRRKCKNILPPFNIIGLHHLLRFLEKRSWYLCFASTVYTMWKQINNQAQDDFL